MKTRGKCDAVIIDYVQLIVPSDRRESREQQIAHISRQIRLMTLSVKVPIIALAQISRQQENDNRPPRLSDLRESGSLEQDASRVIMLYRPKDKFDGSTQDKDKGYTGTQFDTYLSQLKCKKGPKDVNIKSVFYGEQQLFNL